MTDARVSKTALSALVKPTPDAQVSKTALSVLVKVNGAGSTADATGAGSLTLSAAGAALAPAAGGASLTLAGSGDAAAVLPAAGTASLSLSASGIGLAPGEGVGSASLSLSGSGGAKAAAAGLAALSLSGSGSAHHPATTYPEYVLDDGPVDYWRLGESSGTTAIDSSGNGNDGTFTYASSLDVVHGVTGAIAGDTDTATSFSSTAPTTPTMTAPAASSPAFSVEAWVKGRAVMQLIDTGSGVVAVSVDINSAGIQANVTDSLLAAQPRSIALSIDTTKWHHVVVTRTTGSVLSIYLDAVAHTFTGVSASHSADQFKVFPSADTGGPSFPAADEVAVYDHALTAAQVATHYAIGHGSEGGASLTLSASGGITGASSAGTASLSLSAIGEVPTPAAGEATLDLVGIGTVFALYLTDLSNAMNGRRRGGRATATVDRPAAAVPPGRTYGVRYDKAIAYPVPTMVDGRPT